MTNVDARLEAGIWGIVIILVTAIIHAIGMGLTTSVSTSLQRQTGSHPKFFHGVSALTVAGGMIVCVHLVEIVTWVAFLGWRNSVSTASAAYRALIRDSGNLALLVQWEMLTGFLVVSTLLWSAVVFMTISRRFEEATGTPNRSKRSDGQTIA